MFSPVQGTRLAAVVWNTRKVDDYDDGESCVYVHSPHVLSRKEGLCVSFKFHVFSRVVKVA